MFRRILVSTDGSPRSSRAIKSAAALARTCGASLTIFHAIPVYRIPYFIEGMNYARPFAAQYLKETRREAAKLLAKARALAAKQGVAAATTQAHNDSASLAIVAAAGKARADLVVMASHGRKGWEKLLLGSETQKVLARTKDPGSGRALMRLIDPARASVEPRSSTTGRATLRTEVLTVQLDGAATLPDYLVDTYSWAYLRPNSLRLLDRHLIVNGILWGNYHALVHAACREFMRGDRVLQAACVYGNLSDCLAAKLGSGGFLDIIDVAPVQVAHCRRKLAGRDNVRVRLANASDPGRSGYDGVCCFFLLHEVPDLEKRRIVNALLGVVRPGGKIAFVDYHRPVRWHPLRPIMAAVFRWLEPYAEGLVSRSIPHFSDRPQDFSWRQETRFAGLYQVVVAKRPR